LVIAVGAPLDQLDQLVTEPVRTRPRRAGVKLSFGRMVCSIRCRPAAKQEVVPAEYSSTIAAASWLGVMVTLV
jgi:hypothetical protein